MKKHNKHTNLNRPSFGNFGWNEWAIIGTPCGKIQHLAFELTSILSEKYKVSYVDADHKSADEAAATKENNALARGANFEYTDKISHHRFESKEQMDSFQFRNFFNDQDIVLVNGNHFKAKAQIVVIDAKKENSLKKKLDRLTNVQLILLAEGEAEIFPFLQEHLSNHNEIPVLSLNDVKGIANFLWKEMEVATPPLYGLVLAGGKSVRMGTDKGALDYHGKPQREHMAETLDLFCEKTFLSVRGNQGIDSDYELLEDTFVGLGPFGAIASAFRAHPNAAWLVVACDLPLLDKEGLSFLVKNRNISKVATTFHSPHTNFPEPLITIWEPRSYPVLLQFLTQGYSCPRKVLINSDIQEIHAENPAILTNVNDREAYRQVKGEV